MNESADISHIDERVIDVHQIKQAYELSEDSLRMVGRFLRTTNAGRHMWASDHKIIVTGLRIILERLRRDLPDYTDSG